ncbi:MAG: UDP-glucose 4-epimerase GalE [Brevundimonas sp.]|nr:MAG: UDP-glucose 4-epimerase GalE [Brevundimonas sp.]
MILKTVLVTGGAGYIGSHTAKALAASGIKPVVYDDFSNGHRGAVRWGPLIKGDVRDQARLAETMARFEIDAVIHFAGLIEVGRSVVAPDRFWDINLNGTAAVAGAMRDTGITRLVFSSTAAVYGQPSGDGLGRLSEPAAKAPLNPYGDSKLAAERLVAAYGRAYGLEGVALRYFNAAGADPSGDLGEAHACESHLIPLAIEAALGLGPALTVHGCDYPTPDGGCLRDYVHVCDLARAHVLALTAPVGPSRFEAFNLGSGRGRSVLEVIAAVDRATGRTTPYTTGVRREGDPAVLVADPGRAATVMGWRAERSTLDQIVGDAVAWRKAPRFGFQPPSEAAA